MPKDTRNTEIQFVAASGCRMDVLHDNRVSYRPEAATVPGTGVSPPRRRCTIRHYPTGSYLADLAADAGAGLAARQKYLPSRYFYDETGSRLFEEICTLPEYYPTRTEHSILAEAAGYVMASFDIVDLVDLGSGQSNKIETLIDAAEKPGGSGIRYVPIDVSESAVVAAAAGLTGKYPHLLVHGIVGDFTRDIREIPNGRQRLFAFFGGTIGNFEQEEARTLLGSVAASMAEDDRFLIGLDMVKPVPILEAAYNDAAGVTAEFNRNILRVLNRGLRAEFDPARFDHVAFFNRDLEQIEMHLSAREEMAIPVPGIGMTAVFEEGETIRTEISRKFTHESAERLFDAAGLSVKRWFTDDCGWFSLAYLAKQGR